MSYLTSNQSAAKFQSIRFKGPSMLLKSVVYSMKYDRIYDYNKLFPFHIISYCIQFLYRFATMYLNSMYNF